MPAKAVAAYKEKRDVRLFDTYLDHAFFHALNRALATDAQSQDVKKLVSTDIDSYNVLAVLRGKFWGLSQQDITDLIVTTTPKVTRESLQKMINTEKPSEAIGELNNTVYRDIIPQNAANDIDAIMQLEAGFESVALKRVVSSFRAVFTVAIMLSAIKLMIIEVKNLAGNCGRRGTKGSCRNDNVAANQARVKKPRLSSYKLVKKLDKNYGIMHYFLDRILG